MRKKLYSKGISERQKHILELLSEKEYLQNKLQEALSMTAPNLHYHLTRLEATDLIKKETLYEIGNAKTNRISLNPAARQQVRQIIGLEIKYYTLITGLGALKTGYRVPDLVLKILKKYKFSITRIVCFSTPDAKKKREEHQLQEKLQKIDRYIIYPYVEYRYIESEFFQKAEHFLSEEMKDANIIIDLTPLSKLFSFKLLELANKYQLPCMYLGLDKNGRDKLFLMSNMRIEGEIKPFS